MVVINTSDIIDIDKMGLKIEHTIQRFGKTICLRRCDDVGVYNRGEKISLLMAISGD